MRKKTWLPVLLILLLPLALSGPAKADCYDYSNSTPQDYPMSEGGYACAGSGPGCSQCVNYYSWGFRICTYDWFGDVLACYTYGGPENQIP